MVNFMNTFADNFSDISREFEQQMFFGIWRFLFEIQFKNTSNLIFLGFKVPSESFFHKDFKIGLTFWYMWF